MCLSEGFNEIVKNARTEKFEVIKRKIKMLEFFKYI